MRHALATIALWLAGTGFGLAAEDSLVERQWTVDGAERKALVYVPMTNEGPRPVVFAFHGHGGTMANAARMFAYHKHWPEAIVVYMQGLNTPGRLSDPEGKRPGWQHFAGEQNDRDLRFFDAVLASIKSECSIDDNRIYATGHSNGGGFTYLLWAQRGSVFAAVAPSGSVANRYLKDLQSKPALHVAGEADALVKFEWQQRGMESLKKLNGCDAKGTSWQKSGDLVGTLYPSKTGTPFVSVIYPGSHKFPTEAAVMIAKFFKQHELTVRRPKP